MRGQLHLLSILTFSSTLSAAQTPGIGAHFVSTTLVPALESQPPPLTGVLGVAPGDSSSTGTAFSPGYTIPPSTDDSSGGSFDEGYYETSYGPDGCEAHYSEYDPDYDSNGYYQNQNFNEGYNLQSDEQYSSQYGGGYNSKKGKRPVTRTVTTTVRQLLLLSWDYNSAESRSHHQCVSTRTQVKTRT